MRHVLVSAVLWIALSFGAAAQGDAIRDTIGRQLEAFGADDFSTAFTFATPSLQTFFDNPDNFRQMVTRGYPMVWRNSDVRFLELLQDGGAIWQKVRIVDDKGEVHILAYRMVETDEGWRIGGVQLLESQGANV